MISPAIMVATIRVEAAITVRPIIPVIQAQVGAAMMVVQLVTEVAAMVVATNAARQRN